MSTELNEKYRYTRMFKAIANRERFPVSKTPLDDHIAYYLVHLSTGEVAALIARLMEEILIQDIKEDKNSA